MALQNTTTTLKSQEKRMPVTTFLRDTFFPHAETFVTEDVDVDFYKGGQKIAPFVANNVGGINLKREGFTTKRYTTPRIAPQRPLSAAALNVRLLGENIHSTMSPEERASKLIERDAIDMDDQITRREELMAAQLITTGRIEVKGYVDDSLTQYVDDSVDFRFDQNIMLTGDSMWTGNASKKYDDIARACELTMKSGYTPRYGILGIESYKLLLSDEAFLKRLDISNLAIASLAPRINAKNGNGVKIIGRINDLGIDLYAYYAWYDDGNVQKPYIPGNKIITASENLGEFLYGAVTQMEGADQQMHTYEGTRVPKEWADVGNDVKMVRLSSRPLVRPYDVDGWATIDTFTV